MFIFKGKKIQHYYDFTVGQYDIGGLFMVIKDPIEQMRDFIHRKRKGVSTADLDPVWNDTLKSWRERPPELDKELKNGFFVRRFTLWRKDETWLIFQHAYYQFSLPHANRPSRIIYNSKKDSWRRFRRQKTSPMLYRRPDHIAVNRLTGEVRRFVDVTANEVLDDLREIYPAPAQIDLTNFWGKRKPSGIREKMREHVLRQLKDEQGHINIIELVRLSHFPLYGPVGNLFNLTLDGNLLLNLTSSNGLSSVGFFYSRSQAHIAIELMLPEADTCTYTFVDENTPDQAPSPFDLAHAFLQRTNQSEEKLVMTRNSSFWKGDLTIAGDLFTGELHHTSQPDQLSWFSLTSEQVRLTGNSYGLSEGELFQWIKTLQIINQRDDVLLSYQREYDEDWQKMRLRFGK